MTDDDRSWQDDLRGELIQDFLSRVVCAAERVEIELPHIVVCTDPETGAVSYTGPFPDGMTALVAAEREYRAEAGTEDGLRLEFSVAALYPVPGPADG